MKRLTFCLVSLAVMAGALAAAEEARFMTYPTIHKSQVVFTYENDLWATSVKGGCAERLTHHPNTENFAKFSPDGKWIAFSGGYDGMPAVYVMSADGGEPVRLTYTPGPSFPVGWTPDSRRIIFRSMFENVVGRDPNLYFVDREGAAPERFPLDRGVLASFSPDGSKILYCRRGNEEYYWKRYKGGQYQDIWLYDFKTKAYTPVSDYVGKNSYPMWVGDTMYFVSDRTNGIANLYKQKVGTKDAVPVTRYTDFDIMMPQTDGERVIYVQDGALHVYDTASGTDERLRVECATDRWMRRPRFINPRDYIHAMDVGNDGKAVVLEARGDVFVLDPEPERTLNLSETPGTRETHPQLSPDGQWVAFFSDKAGDYQLYVQKVTGGEWTPLTTSLDRTVYRLVWSPDGKKLLFGNKDFAISYVDVAAKKVVAVDASNQMKNDEFFWEVSDYGWSPDSNWICYSFVQYNRNSQVFLYHLPTGKRYAVTDDFYDNLNPCFDANGKYLYYLSSRDFTIQMDFYEDNHVMATPQQVMVVQLQAGEKPPFWGKPVGEKKDEAPAAGPLRIDVEGLKDRTYPLPVPAGNYFFLRAGKGKALWSAVDKFTEDEYEEIFKPGGRAKWDLHVFDMAERKEAVLGEKISDFRLSSNGEQVIVRRGGEYTTSSVAKAFASKALGERVNLQGMLYRVDPLAEWHQIFNDAWRWYRDFFYDAGFHGRDWKAMGDAYRARIPFLSTRAELNWLLQQMVGELCVSHTYISGGDMSPQGGASASPLFTGLLGCDLVADTQAGYYRIARIYGPTEHNRDLRGPLVRPDIDVKEGDYLIAINGREVKPPADYFKLLQVLPGQKVKVTVAAKPASVGAKTYEVEPLRSDNSLRYFRWLTDNINKVLAATDGRVGYMHINAMGSGGIGEFDKFWRAFRYKEGLILDLRRNSGGWTEYFLIDKLERQLVAFNNLRDMVPFRYPGAAGNGNYVVVSNENNGSDGEAFVEHFKARKLGTVVGVPSWGGLVGILNGQATIDNGTIQQSNNAFFGREGTWWVENHGADPDILIDNDPASVVAGRDPQLDKAIEVVLEKVKANPLQFPARPPYPKK